MPEKSTPSDGRTKISRMQVFRMARIVSLLKKNRMPSAEMLLKEYEKLEYEENQLIRAKYTYDADHLPLVNMEIDALQHLQRPKTLRYILNINHISCLNPLFFFLSFPLTS